MFPGHLREPCRDGFSLVEVLVIIGITGICLGLILPAVQQVRESAARAKCMNNLKQIGIGLHHFHDSNGCLPPRRSQQDIRRTSDPDTLLTWMALILPQMDDESLWKLSAQACQFDPLPYHNPPHVGYATVIATYVCPDDARLLGAQTTPSGDHAAFASYIGIGGIPGIVGEFTRPPILGPLGGAPGVRLTDMTDGTSLTIMVGERPPPNSWQAGRWYSAAYGLERFPGPDAVLWFPSLSQIDDLQCSQLTNRRFGPGRMDNPCDRFHLWSLHPRGANFLFADGSVRFLGYTVDPLIPALSTCAGGELIELP